MEIWNAFLADARQIASTDDYDKWIQNLRFVAEVDKSVLIAARDRLTYDRISANHRPMLKRVWRKVDPKGRALEIACWKDIPVATRELAGNPWEVEQSVSAEAGVTAETLEAPAATSPQTGNMMTFDTLIVGDTNKRAVRLAEQLVEGTMLRAEVSLIYGRQGTGKTHILRAIESAIAASGDDRRVTYMTAEEFMTAYIDGAREGDTRDLKAQVRDNDLLLIDDLQWIAGKKKTDESFFANIRSVTKSGGRVLLTADEAPGDLKGFSQRMRGELLGAATAEVGLPDQEMRREIVRLHAGMIQRDQESFDLTDEMIEKIVSTVRGPGRELCGVLYSLQTETGYGEVEPSMDMLSTVLRRQQGEYQVPTLDNVKRATMRVFNLSKTEIESANKSRNICHPRQIAMYLCREMTDKSLPQIARAFSK
ncbi:MAG: DnaA/Hda family protein, partial [Henriciella sp.]|uniref:DnaA ATPase domain-containing protein n=1 Tax=Henriciella sp. TaxID=1968823 RepID=UPI003C77ED69